MNAAFVMALKHRLEARENEAEAHWIEALHIAGLDHRRAELLGLIGKPLSWRLWNIAIEEAVALVADEPIT